ncbi:hypothetical protein MMC25_000383 [Agyrium rufum]|nr:hypothetical protein [Agyrium rufum]
MDSAVASRRLAPGITPIRIPKLTYRNTVPKNDDPTHPETPLSSSTDGTYGLYTPSIPLSAASTAISSASPTTSSFAAAKAKGSSDSHILPQHKTPEPPISPHHPRQRPPPARCQSTTSLAPTVASLASTTYSASSTPSASASSTSASIKPHKSKLNSLFSFLSTKEPSKQAFLDYQTQMAVHQSRNNTNSTDKKKSRQIVGVPMVSSAKLPDTVPKVNTRWDGMPQGWKDAQQQQHEKEKELAKLLGGRNKLSGSRRGNRSEAGLSDAGSSRRWLDDYASTRADSVSGTGSSIYTFRTGSDTDAHMADTSLTLTSSSDLRFSTATAMSTPGSNRSAALQDVQEGEGGKRREQGHKGASTTCKPITENSTFAPKTSSSSITRPSLTPTETTMTITEPSDLQPSPIVPLPFNRSAPAVEDIADDEDAHFFIMSPLLPHSSLPSLPPPRISDPATHQRRPSTPNFSKKLPHAVQ